MRCKTTQINSLMNSETISANKMHTFPKEIESLKTNKIEILEMKDSTKEIENELVSK